MVDNTTSNLKVECGNRNCRHTHGHDVCGTGHTGNLKRFDTACMRQYIDEEDHKCGRAAQQPIGNRDEPNSADKLPDAFNVRFLFGIHVYVMFV